MLSDLSLCDGAVLDLGCGYGAVAEPLSEMGMEYVGMDTDKAALDDLRGRGFTCFEADLTVPANLQEQVEAAVRHCGGKPIRAILLQDVLEHLPSTRAFLEALREVAEMLDSPLLVVSVPNVAHVDVGAKLALGRFDYTATGLLDSTHLSFFTESRLTRELEAHGWLEVAANDFHLQQSDQAFPPLHPAVASGATFANFIRNWRNEVDRSATVNQFIRAFATTKVVVQGPEQSRQTSPTFLSVIMRTEGSRNENLREALTCLAAQTCDDFTVMLMVHTSNANLVASVQSVVNEFDVRFAARCLVQQVVGGQRARPLNEALEIVDSSYAAFLDDDDLVTGDWVATFMEGAEMSMGQVVRSVTVDQQVHRSAKGEGLASYTIHTGLHPQHASTFDMVQHFYANQTPICSFAVPVETIECFGLRFDEGLPVTEDWEFLLRTTQMAGVHDTLKVTSVYRRWAAGESSVNKVHHKVWESTRMGILHRFDQAPMLLPAGSASRMVELYESSLRLDQARREAIALAVERMEVIDSLREDVKALQEEIRRIHGSASLRVTFPVRWLLHYARRILGRSQETRNG